MFILCYSCCIVILVRFKQASKKFGGDEKQPKLRLIADENSGGFPNSKNNNGVTNVDAEQKNEMQTPGLVARLMGLESMPALQRDKSKKVPASGFGSCEPEKIVDDVCGYSREQLNVEKGGIKHESRPQKLQKTSVCERQPITRFGAEKLPFKNVLSQSRKHHPKLPSPVKSPKNPSRKSSSRLIGAATRILEPGLQTSRLKCAISYSNNLRHPPEDVVVDERIYSLSSPVDDSDGFAVVAPKGQSSCRNCGYWLDNLDSEPSISGQPSLFASPFSHCVGSSCQGPDRIKPGESAFRRQLVEEFHEDYCAVAGQVTGNLQSHVELTSYKSPFKGQSQGHSGCQQCKPPMVVHVSLSSNHKTQNQNQMLRARDTVPPRSKLNGVTGSKVSATNVKNGTKNFVSGSTRLQVPARIDNGKFEQERRTANRLNESVPPGRKRRPSNISRQGESSGSMSSTVKQNFGSPHILSEKRLGYNVHFVNHHCDKNGLLHRQERTVNSGQVDGNVVSFTFNSPVKQKTGIQEVAERRVQNNSQHGGSLRKSALGESTGTKLEKPVPLSGDALGALLEQKLKELNCQGEDIEGNAPRKTTATILQELISALTSEIPFQQDNLLSMSDSRCSWGNHSNFSNSTSSTSSQANAATVKLSVDQPLDNEHLSPGSVLEAYFSTESCYSSSLDDSLGYKMPTESLDCSYHETRLSNPETELLDCAASINTANSSSKESVIDILNNVSEILNCSSFADCGLKGNKLDRTKETLLNTELVLRNACSFAGKNFQIKHLLLDELEALASVLWMNFGCSLGVEEGIEVNQLRRFAFDSIIEYLDSRFGTYPTKAGSKVSRKLPLQVNANALIFEIVEVVKKWDKLCKLSLDELIEREMSHSLGAWTECESEVFENGMEISRDILQVLVDEIVVDLFFC
ncbi:hypothetical protein CDL12_14052 [Handroanthus impetiginosus]|uniref:DUF4378 domain-containing protein n=1 Tax=Handroanthus impetiginosus TaxID=429701 RepID=A0A2G9H732_9LAMI|nr:hypothetical protein CDL12_14052 [Handroanthus impetiginosus]